MPLSIGVCEPRGGQCEYPTRPVWTGWRWAEGSEFGGGLVCVQSDWHEPEHTAFGDIIIIVIIITKVQKMP